MLTMTTESTETTPIWLEVPTACRHLRSKQYYMQYSGHASGMESAAEVACWCLKTMKSEGPDNGTACHDDCTPDRACFEADGV
jgi:hypothetical protein